MKNKDFLTEDIQELLCFNFMVDYVALEWTGKFIF